MKPITLYPHELNRLLATGSVTVWRPIKPQPKWDTFGDFEAWRWECKGGHVHVWDEGRDPDEVAFVNQCAPHPPGNERWVREGWAKDVPYCERGLSYQADHLDPLGDGPANPMKWRSPVTMPRWASRLSVVAREVQARQVQGVLDIDAEAAGFGVGATIKAERFGGRLMSYGQYRFMEWWQSRYGKPCKTCKGYGVIVGWCGSPHDGSLEQTADDCPDCNGEPMPLEFDANPWAWATTLTRKDEG